jgi:hypothetical protein
MIERVDPATSRRMTVWFRKKGFMAEYRLTYLTGDIGDLKEMVIEEGSLILAIHKFEEICDLGDEDGELVSAVTL